MSSSDKNVVNVTQSAHFDEFRCKEEFCDVVIKIENKNFPCHRIILASSTEYFQSMFTQNYSETDKKEIELKGIRAADFELFLIHIYGGSVNLKDDDNAYRLLRISAYLNLKSLDDLCSECATICNSIPLSTSIILVAYQIGNASLTDQFIRRIAENFVDASRNKQFLRISSAELLKVLAHPDLNSDATATLNFLVNWVEFQSVEDKKLVLGLLNAVDLREKPNEWFANMIVENTVRLNAFQNEEGERRGGADRVQKVQTVQAHSTVQCETDECLFSDVETDDDKVSCNRNEVKLPFILYTRDIQGDGKHNYCMNKYQFRGFNSLQLLDQNPKIERERVEFCKSVFIDEIQFMMTLTIDGNDEDDDTSDGGSESFHFSRRSDGADLALVPYVCHESENHRKVSYYSFSCEYLSMTAHEDEIFLYSDGEFCVYNCNTDRWYDGRRSPYIKRKTKYSNLVSYNNSLYVIGGEPIYCMTRESRAVPKCYGRYLQHCDLREGKCQQLPDMKYPRIRSASCIHNDVLYVSGGKNLTYYKGYMECFDFKAGKWSVIESSMPQPKFDHIMTTHNNHLWFFGGKKYASKSDMVDDFSWYSFELNERKWSDIFSIPNTYGKFKMQSILDVVVEI